MSQGTNRESEARFAAKTLAVVKKRGRGGVAVEKIRVTDRTDFAVAEKSAQGDFSKRVSNDSSIVIRHAEHS